MRVKADLGRASEGIDTGKRLLTRERSDRDGNGPQYFHPSPLFFQGFLVSGSCVGVRE